MKSLINFNYIFIIILRHGFFVERMILIFMFLKILTMTHISIKKDINSFFKYFYSYWSFSNK